MDMASTVELMLSDNHKDRLKAEYYQLKIRYEKLKILLDKWDKGELKFIPTCARVIYDVQIEAMEKYLDVLSHRIVIEEIELEEGNENDT